MVTVRGSAGGAVLISAPGLLVAPSVGRVEDDAAASVVDRPGAASCSPMLGAVLAGFVGAELGLMDVAGAAVGGVAPRAVQDATAQATASIAAARRHLTAQMLRAAAPMRVGPADGRLP
jgi:hypothetical protein